MRVITVSNIKGGSTKSTLAIHLGLAFARRGKTLVVDMDMQSDTTDFFLPSITPDDLDKGNVFKLLIGESTLGLSIRKAKTLDILPGTLELNGLQARLFQNISIVKKLDFFLKATDYEFVVIDTPGSARAELTISLATSDTVIIPVTPSKWAIRAVNILVDEIANASMLSGTKPKIAFVPSLFGNSVAHREILERIKSITEIPTLSEIPKTETIKNRTEKHQGLKEGTIGWNAYEKVATDILELSSISPLT